MLVVLHQYHFLQILQMCATWLSMHLQYYSVIPSQGCLGMRLVSVLTTINDRYRYSTDILSISADTDTGIGATLHVQYQSKKMHRNYSMRSCSYRVNSTL